MNVRYLVLAGAVALAVSSHAYAGTVYDVNFVGTDGAGAVTANLVLDVVNNTVVSGTGTITQSAWGTASMTFLSSPTLGTTYEFNGGTELSGDDNAFPIDNNGLAFNVGTAAQVGQYQTGGGFGIWSTGGNTYQAFLGDTVNGASLWEYASGTATVSQQVSAVPVPGALPLFGSALVGVGALAARRRAKLA